MSDAMDLDAVARQRDEALEAALAGLEEAANSVEQMRRVAPEQEGIAERARYLQGVAQTMRLMV